jgi:hypothetical protein
MSPSIAVCGNYWSAPCTSLYQHQYQQLYQHIVGPYVAASAPAVVGGCLSSDQCVGEEM